MKSYIMNIVNGSTISFAEVNFVSYIAPKLVLRLHPKDADKVPLLRAHVSERTVFPIQLEYRGTFPVRSVQYTLSGLRQTMNYGDDRLWTSPQFKAQVTAAGEPPLHFELMVLDDADLSELK